MYERDGRNTHEHTLSDISTEIIHLKRNKHTRNELKRKSREQCLQPSHEQIAAITHSLQTINLLSSPSKQTEANNTRY